MARPVLLRLTEHDRELLADEIRDTPAADVRDACRAVLLVGGGTVRDAVGKQLGVHPATVGRWAARFRSRGIAGLRGPEKDRRGRPARLRAAHLDVLREAAVTPPGELGYAFTAWTLPRLATHLAEKTGVTAQPAWIGRLLRRMNIRRRRPKHVLEGKRDEALHDAAKAEIDAIKKELPSSTRVVISQDEAEFHLFPYLVLIWGLVGSVQPQVRTPGRNEKRVLYGGLNLGTGMLSSYWADTKSGAHFIEFLEVLLADYPDRSILLVADNGSFHHTKKVAAFLDMHEDRLEVRWLPPYCPDLNDIERTWRRLKASHASNFLFNSLDHLIANVQRGVDEMNAKALAITRTD